MVWQVARPRGAGCLHQDRGGSDRVIHCPAPRLAVVSFLCTSPGLLTSAALLVQFSGLMLRSQVAWKGMGTGCWVIEHRRGTSESGLWPSPTPPRAKGVCRDSPLLRQAEVIPSEALVAVKIHLPVVCSEGEGRGPALCSAWPRPPNGNSMYSHRRPGASPLIYHEDHLLTHTEGLGGVNSATDAESPIIAGSVCRF